MVLNKASALQKKSLSEIIMLIVKSYFASLKDKRSARKSSLKRYLKFSKCFSILETTFILRTPFQLVRGTIWRIMI